MWPVAWMKTITLAVRLAKRSQNGNRLSVLSLRCIADSNRSNVEEDPRMFCLPTDIDFLLNLL